MTEKLKYIIEDNILAEILGQQNFSTKESAILELVKNAYDAGSTELYIDFLKDKQGKNILTVTDNGTGMNYLGIQNTWMHVGKTSRGYLDSVTNRVYAGSKGIGRFALARLGKNIEMYTRQMDGEGLLWKTDWNNSTLEQSTDVSKGTTFIIHNLRDNWGIKSIESLKSYLSKVYFNDQMKIYINNSLTNEVIKEKVELLWNTPCLGENFVSDLYFEFDSNNFTLFCRINSDEFKNNIFELIKDDLSFSSYDDSRKVYEFLRRVGSFKGHLYFSLSNINNIDYEKFEYKYKNLLNRYANGIILYRNAFSIDSYEGRVDWLNLSRRAAASPAAASHPTGTWRVRANQLSGFILIDKEDNKYIEDLSNRQGIVENIYFEFFKKIVITSIEFFEGYRQGIIRDINKYKELDKYNSYSESNLKTAESILGNIQRKPEDLNKITLEDLNTIHDELNRKNKEIDSIKIEKEKIEENYRYETQLLNVLATSQLKISSLGHEINNNRNELVRNPLKIEEELKKKLNWDELNLVSPKNKNIPYLIDSLKKGINKVINLIDNILDESKKENFLSKEYLMKELVEIIINKWKEQYVWVDFKVELNGNEYINISSDYIMIILDNLILNSIQQNDRRSNLNICVSLSYDGESLILRYSDDGKGLEEKYLANPMKILNVHETSRVNGHGLGMWIVNNTIHKLGGEITEISSNGGFSLSAVMHIYNK
ncbi:ATP-binding protein [Actinobacillus equuli subsp. haemolyticus]|uniref:sensor histidine kinase n=1 Tax=Actinobacillus equuli TaxID=718 RepID=UPI0024187147|nr:sensor histidine kinase [Actinobacillus equuli]MDG4949004.1 ATP-binding protein [Actinobacillus equuli subsp. haemolyticus]